MIDERPLAALGTLHQGAPYVSMVPFAIRIDAASIIIHVSGLAAHTRDMLEDPRVSMLIMDKEGGSVSPQAHARVTIQGHAEQVAPGTPDEAACRRVYVQRFPEAERLLMLGDFSFFAIRPTTIRLVGGFAQAVTATPDDLLAALRA